MLDGFYYERDEFKMENNKWQNIVKKSIVLIIIVLILFVIGIIILKYNVEGEQNMPFNLSDVLVISSAEGYQENETKNKWNVNIYQTNDIYLDIKKNKNYRDKEIIKSIEILNIQIQNPTVGNVQIYRPSGDGKSYEYNDEYKIGDTIKFEGDKKSDLKNLKISNQGGRILFRVLNNTEKQYISNENEIKHDGTLLNKVGITNDDVKFTISFDIKIELESGVTFDGNLKIDLPKGNIINQGTASSHETDVKDVVFKRE